MNHEELLDTEELMHLALQATARLDSGTAIEYLKRLLSQAPERPEALYLLGAHEAQIGLYSRALGHMARAVELKPDMDIARFQLGWLQLNAGDTSAATSTWHALDALGDAHPLVLFKTGLLHLAREELDPCIASLERGLAANTDNAPLNNDVTTLIERLKQRQRESASVPALTTQASDDVPAMYLDAYTSRRS